jgi:elongation factor 1-gamma
MKLYSNLGGFRTNKILVAAHIVEAPIELVVVDHAKIKEPEFLKKNPNGKIPVLETKEGTLFESNSILRYVARIKKDKGLYGTNEYQESQVDQWLDWCGLELEPPLLHLMLPIFGWTEFDKDQNKKAQSDMMAVLRILDAHLKVHNHMVGSSLTIADIAICSALIYPMKFLWEEKYRKNFAAVTKYVESTAAHGAFAQVFGKLRLCQKSMEPAHLEKAAPATKKDQPKDAKADKPVEKKKKKDDDNDEEDEPVVKSEKNPLDSLPPSKFNLFDFKTLFVNAADKHEALKFFWENYDNEGYSLYNVHYIKVEGEGKVLFLTNNMMNGFLQRLEHFRKYAFAVHGVYGEEPNLEIKGVWCWRGQGIPFEIKDLDSYEFHTWTKLDPSKPEDRKKVTESWTGLNEGAIVDGLTAREVKYFK